MYIVEYKDKNGKSGHKTAITKEGAEKFAKDLKRSGAKNIEISRA